MRLFIPAGLLLLSLSVLQSSAQTESTCTPIGGSCSSLSNCCFNPVVSCNPSGAGEGKSCSIPNFTNVSPGTAAVIRTVLTFVIMVLNQFFGQQAPGSAFTSLFQNFPFPLSFT